MVIRLVPSLARVLTFLDGAGGNERRAKMKRVETRKTGKLVIEKLEPHSTPGFIWTGNGAPGGGH